MAQKGGLDATWTLVTHNFDSPLHFTPTLGGLDPLGAFAPHPNGQKRSKRPKMAQNDQNGPQNGSRRHLGPRDPLILTPRPILPQLWGARSHLEPLPRTQMAKKGSKKAQKGQKWLKMAKNGPKIGSRRHLGPRDTPILTPRPTLPQF